MGSWCRILQKSKNGHLYFLLFICLLVSCFSAIAQVDETDWMLNYYKNPQPDQVVEKVNSMARAGLFSKKDKISPFIGFLSQLMASNPKMLTGWLDTWSKLGKDDKEAIYLSAWHSRTQEAKAYFQLHNLNTYLDKSAPDILSIEVDNPDTLDTLWGRFFASGSEVPIRRIVSSFALSKYMGSLDRYKDSLKTQANKEDAFLDATFQSAVWSVESNCRQHPRVLEICEKIYNENSLQRREQLCLFTILQKINPDKYQKISPTTSDANTLDFAWRDKDGKPLTETPQMKSKGGFGAEIILTADLDFYEKWAKPEPPSISAVSSVKHGQKIIPIILFANPMKNKDGYAKINFDLEIIRPDGSISSSHPNLVAMEGPYNGPTMNLQLASTKIIWNADPGDPKGLWIFKVKITDQVRKVSLNLESQLIIK